MTPPGEAWDHYRKLVLAEIERLDQRDRMHEDRMAAFVEAATKFHAQIEKDVEAIDGRRVGFAKEVEHIYATKVDLKAEVDRTVKAVVEAAHKDMAVTPAETIRGLWEFRVALITGIFSVLLAILALVRSGA
jgi:hypothetical protein